MSDLLASVSTHHDLTCHKNQDALRKGRLAVERADAVLALLERQRRELLCDGCWTLDFLSLSQHNVKDGTPDTETPNLMNICSQQQFCHSTCSHA